MFFTINNTQTFTNWQNNWQIRSEWTGSLVNRAALIPNDKYTEKYYLKPFFLLSLLPQHSIKLGKVLKLYVGFHFKGLMNKLNTEGLEILYSMFGFNFGLTINDKFEKGCTLLMPDDDRSIYVDDHIFKKNKQSNFKTINWTKPILIPLKCLKKKQKNHINFWWKSKNNHINFSWSKINKQNIFLDEIASVKIEFFYPQDNEINFQLKTKQPTNIIINYWYLIENKLGNPTKITPILGENLTLISKIKKNYQNATPFESFWQLTYHPIRVQLSNWKLLLQYFQFKYWKNDLKQIQNWNQPPLFAKTESIVKDSMQEQNIKGKILYLEKQFQIDWLKIPEYKKQVKESHSISFYKTILFHKVQTRNSWNSINNKLVNNNFSDKTLLTNWKTSPNPVILVNNFLWNKIIPIKINFTQQTVFFNNFWNKKLIFEEINGPFSISKKTITEKWEFLIPFLDLKKIAFINDFTFKKYLLWKIQWQKIYEQKNS